MDKQRLINQLRGKLHENTRVLYSKSELNEIVVKIIEVIMENLNNGEKIHLSNLGTFEVKLTKSRRFYNIQSGLFEITKPRRYIDFTPSRKFRTYQIES